MLAASAALQPHRTRRLLQALQGNHVGRIGYLANTPTPRPITETLSRATALSAYFDGDVNRAGLSVGATWLQR